MIPLESFSESARDLTLENAITENGRAVIYCLDYRPGMMDRSHR